MAAYQVTVGARKLTPEDEEAAGTLVSKFARCAGTSAFPAALVGSSSGGVTSAAGGGGGGAATCGAGGYDLQHRRRRALFLGAAELAHAVASAPPHVKRLVAALRDAPPILAVILYLGGLFYVVWYV